MVCSVYIYATASLEVVQTWMLLFKAFSDTINLRTTKSTMAVILVNADNFFVKVFLINFGVQVVSVYFSVA